MPPNAQQWNVSNECWFGFGREWSYLVKRLSHLSKESLADLRKTSTNEIFAFSLVLTSGYKLSPVVQSKSHWIITLFSIAFTPWQMMLGWPGNCGVLHTCHTQVHTILVVCKWDKIHTQFHMTVKQAAKKFLVPRVAFLLTDPLQGRSTRQPGCLTAWPNLPTPDQVARPPLTKLPAG